MAIKISVKNSLVYSALLFSVIALVFVVVNILAFANKGFQLSDETFYLHYSLQFNSNDFVVTNFGLLNKFFCFGHPTLLNLRLAKFVYQSLAVMVLVFCLFKFLNTKGFNFDKIHKIFILVIALMASYCNYDYLPMTLSYNTWSLILMALCFSVILNEYSLSKLSGGLFSSILYGFLCFCFFLTKFPNAVIAVFIYMVFNLVSIKNNSAFKLLGLLIGFMLGYFVFLNNFNDLKNIFDNYYISLFEIQHVQANSYYLQISNFFELCFQRHFLRNELLVLLSALIIKKYLKVFRQGAFYLLLSFNFFMSTFFYKGNSLELYNDFMVATLFIINAFLLIYMFSNNLKQLIPKREFGLITLFLFAAPFFLMLGTDNIFYYTTSQTMVFSIMAIIIYLIYTKQLNIYFLAINSCVMCVFIVSVLYQGAVKTPYRQDNLLAKNYPMHFSEPINGIYESYDRFVDYTSMNCLINAFNSNKPVVTFFNYMGLSFVNNCKIYPQSIISDSDHAMYYNEYILNRYNFNDRFDLIVMPETVENSEEFKNMFSKYGILLNKNYKLKYVYTFLSTGEKVYFYKKQA